MSGARKAKAGLKRPSALDLEPAVLPPAGPAQTREGAEGRKDGWTNSGSWFVINGEIRVGRDRIQRQVQSPTPGEAHQTHDSWEMTDIHPDDLEGNRFIGKGASGVVTLMHHKRTGKPYAVKVIHFGIIVDKDMVEQEIRQLEVSSRYVVRGFTAFMHDKSLHIVQEYMDLGSLSDVLRRAETITETPLRGIAKQLFCGLKELHEGVPGQGGRTLHRIHRDLKPANLLMNSAGEVKIADFGIATTTNTVGKSTFVGTTTYMSPERIRGHRYGTASDVWSAGLLLVECATGDFPFKKKSTFIELLIDITSTERVALPDRLSPECKDFLWRCMRQKPEERPSVADLLNHPWLNPEVRIWSPEVHSACPRDIREFVKVMLTLATQRPTAFGISPDLLLGNVFPFLSDYGDPAAIVRDWIEVRNLKPQEQLESAGSAASLQ